MARPGRFTADDIANIRNMYTNARAYSDDLDPADEEYETVLDTEERLATAFRVSRSMIRRIVIGLAYADMPGPIDEQRQAAASESREDVNATELTVTRPGGNPKVFIYPAGTLVGVRAIATDLAEFTDTGLPKDKTSSGAKSGKASTAAREAAPVNRAPAKTAREKDEERLKDLYRRMIDPHTPRHRVAGIRTQYEQLRGQLHGYGDSDAGSSSGMEVELGDL